MTSRPVSSTTVSSGSPITAIAAPARRRRALDPAAVTHAPTPRRHRTASTSDEMTCTSSSPAARSTAATIDPPQRSRALERLLAPSTSWVARSARATPTRAIATSSPTTSRYLPAELVEQPPLRVEPWAGPPGQTVAGRHEHAEQLTGGSSGHARGAPDHVIAARRARDRDEHTLARLPRVVDVVQRHVLAQPVLDPVGDPQQGELAQRGEVARPEVVGERGVDLVRRVDVAVRQATAQRLRRHVDELDLVGAADERVGHRLELADPGDPLDDVVHRLEVLDVDGRDHVDAGVEDRVDVLPPLLVRRAGHVRVRQLVDEDHLRARAMTASRSISSNDASRWTSVRRGTTSRSSSCAAVKSRPCVSTYPTTTSAPRSRRRRPSPSIAHVLPTPGAAPR